MYHYIVDELLFYQRVRMQVSSDFCLFSKTRHSDNKSDTNGLGPMVLSLRKTMKI